MQYLEILKDPEIPEVLTHLHPKREILYQVNMDHFLWQMKVRTKSYKRVEPAWTISSNLYLIPAPVKGCWQIKTYMVCLPTGLLNYSSLPVVDTSLVERVCQTWFIADMTSQDRLPPDAHRLYALVLFFSLLNVEKRARTWMPGRHCYDRVLMCSLKKLSYFCKKVFLLQWVKKCDRKKSISCLLSKKKIYFYIRAWI